MSAKWEKAGKNSGELTFEISEEQIKQGLDEAFKRVKKNLNVPGFRKGKVPRLIFNQMYGEEALYEEALNSILPDVYAAAIKEAGIENDIVGQPQIEPESMDKGAAWVMKATIATKPAVELGDYTGLEVEKQDRRVLVKDVNAQLESKRELNAELVLKEKGKSADGDTVVIDYKGTVDGESFDGGSADNYSLVLGSNSFIPGFEEQLVGHEAGDDVDVVVTFPEDYQAKDLAGKEAHFATKIHEIKTKELPNLDDDFAKDVDDSVQTLDELKEKIKGQLKEQKAEAADEAVQELAVAQAVANATIEEIPQVMIDDEVNTQLQQYLGNMQRQGISPEMYYQITGTSEDDLKQQIAGTAEDHVKTNLVLEAIVAKEGLTASDDEIKDEIKNLAAEYNMDEKVVRQTLTDDMLGHDIAVRKAIELVASSAKEAAKKSTKKSTDNKEAKEDK
ncbi:trigger factor [Amylolactobacillus amylotrophicus DSM 20534]|uniref:Trigger factor n=3 Tax=Amylolactobacillus TaxID=2767876 RepID=A0A1L6XDT8_9LACO|nr:MULTISPECIES: trigger factor [Amylolactobacillus]APT19142.1 trigger factor [Amylolactobacillus amylophilus DSM 20533 = JCM 1125]KRK38588.1 trigger factor [Amylolactobacillus amylotrophicus DSM 20534]KRM42769.1 trigger factor [Amylolactobacillus amylophilus DSM 20533 = JCM 1125]GED79632.1 trigger factor [Amylolactobacillus amylophilus]